TEYEEVTSQLAQIETIIKPTMTSQEIQELLNHKGSFKFLAGEYLLDLQEGFPEGVYLDIQSDTSITFEKGAVIRIVPNDLSRYIILQIDSRENVSINGAVIFGDRDEHTGETGEWGHGISIKGSSKVVIEN